MTNINIYFLSFGGPTDNYIDAVNRICNQAIDFNLFKKIYKYTDKDLINETEFWSKHKDFIKNNKRGYGYWIWKPYLIMKTLKEINNNDILLYCDAGCELNKNGLKMFNDFIKNTEKKLIIGSKTVSSDYRYTKMDVIKFFNIDNLESLKLNHMQAGILMMLKCDKIVSLITEWYEICSNNYNLIDDSPSINKNNNYFVENRHDQSIFNLLVKKYNLINYDLGIYRNNRNTNKEDYINGLMYPIWCSRNKTGKSILP